MTYATCSFILSINEQVYNKVKNIDYFLLLLLLLFVERIKVDVAITAGPIDKSK